jgi:hypothetical protein
VVMSAEWSEVLAGSDVGRLVGGWSEDRSVATVRRWALGWSEWSAAEWSAAMLGNWSEDCRRIHTAGRSTSRSTGRCGDVGGVSTGYGDARLVGVWSEDWSWTSRSTGDNLARRTGRFNGGRWRCWRNGRRRCWATGRRTVGGYVGDRW